MSDDRWKNLEVWQLADAFAREVYVATENFPKEEMYGVTSQLRRAALSVPTNIVEGYSRRGDRELARFTDIALGSLAESKYLLHFSSGLGYDLEKITHRAKNSRSGCSDYLFTSRYYEVHLSKPELALPLIISQTDSEA